MREMTSSFFLSATIICTSINAQEEEKEIERKLQIFKKGTGCDESQLQYHKNLVLSLVLNPFHSLCYIWWFYVPHTKNALSSMREWERGKEKVDKKGEEENFQWEKV